MIEGIPGIFSGLSRETFIEQVRSKWWTRDQNNRSVDAIIYEYTDWSDPNDEIIARSSFQELFSDAAFKSSAIFLAQMLSRANVITYFYQVM